MNKSDLLQNQQPKPTTSQRLWAWVSILLTIILLLAGVWYLVSRVSLAEMAQALTAANPWLIATALAVMIITLLLKAWRWQLMFPPRHQAPPLPPFFWAMLLGAYINTLIPFLRLGELARIVAIDRGAGIKKTQALATLVLEKTLELLMLGLTVLVVITAVTLPPSLNQTTTTLTVSAAALIILLLLYLIAAQTELVIRVMEAMFGHLPAVLGQRLSRWTVSGLAGLAALRSRRLALLLLALSALIAACSVATPLLLLWAFHLPFGWVEAAIINIAIMVALAPPSTPGKIGVFDGVVAFLLLQFGYNNEAVIASYTIVYHLVVVLPLILLGSYAAAHTKTPLRQEWL
ncbi:MAG TPA: lysylphosphatidylglycerol synthase transmembrane domain-containing protein [Chloroflexota bacterium]|nr:lysylphosphatidylglycerol synthase transmembrane domain-containing protein [Chloroflexota bacterium]